MELELSCEACDLKGTNHVIHLLAIAAMGNGVGEGERDLP